ncbi:hypothetical protein ACI782_24310 [Geodermatophilus sp. SYSU D00703]
MTDGPSFYEAVGGRDTFVRLVDRFHDGVASDPVLCGMYQAGLGPARERMTAFLAQYWGGRATTANRAEASLTVNGHEDFWVYYQRDVDGWEEVGVRQQPYRQWENPSATQW